jgi:hypothetical protein
MRLQAKSIILRDPSTVKLPPPDDPPLEKGDLCMLNSGGRLLEVVDTNLRAVKCVDKSKRTKRIYIYDRRVVRRVKD